MPALNIYIQALDEKRFPEGHIEVYLRDLLNRSMTDVALTFAPLRERFSETNPLHDKSILALTKEILKNGGTLGQQGLYSYCPQNHTRRDPWHENWCWSRQFSLEEQLEMMKRGQMVLEKLTGFKSSLYSAPNHYFDDNTIESAKQSGFIFFADNAVIPLRAYEDGTLIVVPQGAIHKGRTNNRDVAYIHYDQIFAHREPYETILKNFVPFSQIAPKKVSAIRKFVNERAKYFSKRLRDVRRLIK